MMRAMDPEEFGKMLKKDPGLIKHEIIDEDRIVLTASTEQLKQFMAEHAKVEGLFGNPSELKKTLEPVDPNITDMPL